jgi:hypothetical protein
MKIKNKKKGMDLKIGNLYKYLKIQIESVYLRVV